MSGWLAISTIASTLVRSVGGLEWQNEVNVSMCNWAQFRASVIRDTIYLDGGELWWQAGLSDGSYASPQNDGGIDGVVYALNLGQPFNQSTNVTGLFKTLPRTGVSASNNIAPNYVDGAMFANDDEWITFGGLVDATNSSSAPAENAILGYEAYQYGPARQSWSSGFITKDLPTNITRYITNGASTSAPSENMGYYFSGMRATDWGPIFNEGGSADTLANTLISVNMSVMRQETWDNDTLPTSIPARANAEIAWIPAGKNGVLVAIGGVINPVSLTAAQALNASQVNASTQTSPTFMDTVSLYDIANKKWYQQNTTGDIPPQLTLFCSVVASARDQSSFNIYIYGGYDGINQSSIPSDDVYILSVPQMIWTHAYTGQSNHGRSGHKCFMVYPDQMMILGGIYAGNPVICLQGGIAEVFNLNNLRFQDSYDPRVWGEYKVPDAVTAKIGGNGNGSATIQSPPTISDVFATAYTKTITTYYPYALQPRNSTNTSSPSPGPTTITVTGGGGLPSWVGPVLGVVLGLVVVAAAIILFLIWRRRKSRRSTRASETQASTNGIRGFVLRWLYGTAVQDAKSQADLGLTDIDGATVVSSKSHDRHVSEAGSVAVHEMEGIGTPVFEMGSNNQAPHWNETQWSQPERSPPLVSPNIDEMMFSSHSQARPIHRNVRHTSSFSTGYRSDESSISEIGSSDPGRPLPKRQEPDNSASDVASLPASQEAGNVETSNREHTSTAVARMSGRITTVPEDEEHNAEDAVSPSGEINDRRQLPHDSTQLE